jgi:hypothetical protein
LTVEERTAEFYSDPLSDISDIESCDIEMADSNLPTKIVQKILQSHLGASSDREPSSTDRSDSETSKQSDTETVDRRCKSDKTPNAERFLGNTVVTVDTDEPSDITQVISAVIRDDLIQLFA